MSDVLDKYRRVVSDSHPKIETLEGQPYKAFESATTPQRRLDLHPGYDAQRIVSYAYLTDVVHAGGVILGLSFSIPALSVEIKGRNLQELIDLLREERITAICEHVAEWHQQPIEDQPYIESLQIVEPGKRSASAPKRH